MSERPKYYYGVRIIRGKTGRTVYLVADRIRIENGDLLLIQERDGKEEIYRAFARGTWFDVFGANCLDGSEIHEDHDVNDETGKDDRGLIN